MKFSKKWLILISVLVLTTGLFFLFQNFVQGSLTQIWTPGFNFYRVKVLKSQINGVVNYQIAGGDYRGRVGLYERDYLNRWILKWSKWTGGFVYSLAAVDANNDGVDDLLVGSADKKLYLFNGVNGNLIKTFEFQAPVWAVEAHKKTFPKGGVVVRIIAGSASGELKLFDRNLQVLHDYTFPRQTGLNNGNLIREIMVGNFSGDATSNDEFLVVRMNKDKFISQNLFQLTGDTRNQLTRIKQICIGANRHSANIRALNGFNGHVGNLRDNDTKLEVVSQYGINTPGLDLHANLCPEGDNNQDIEDSGSTANPYMPSQIDIDNDLAGEAFYGSKYRMEMPVIGNFQSQEGMEIFTVHGQEFFLNNRDGKVIAEVRGSFGFTDVDVIPGADGELDSVVMGSMPNGDESLYILNFDDQNAWIDSLRNMIRPGGKISMIDAQLNWIEELVDNWDSTQALSLYSDTRPARMLNVDLSGEDKYGELRVHNNNNRFKLAFRSGPVEERNDSETLENFPIDRRETNEKRYTREEIINKMNEKILSFDPKANVLIYAGHGAAYSLLPNTYWTAESETKGIFERPWIKNNITGLEHNEGYFEDYVNIKSTLLDRCNSAGVPIALLSKNATWAIGATPSEYQEIIGNRNYRSILVPSGEDSAGALLELSYAGRLGLWYAGYVDHWGFKLGGDLFSTNRHWDWEYPLFGHTYIRYLLNNISKGADFLSLMYDTDTTARYSQAVQLFFKMLDKGIIAIPHREQLGSVSRIAVVYNPPADPNAFDAFSTSKNFGNDILTTDSESGNLFSRLERRWAMAPLRENDVLRKLYNSKRRGLNFLPYADHGHVTWFQHETPTELFSKGFAEVWETDGNTIQRFYRGSEGTIVSSDKFTEWNPELEYALSGSSLQLIMPITGNVVSHVIKQSDRHYQVILIDPGYLDPADRMAQISLVNLPYPANNWKVKDRLTGEFITSSDPASRKVRVLAGLFRVLDVYVPVR